MSRWWDTAPSYPLQAMSQAATLSCLVISPTDDEKLVSVATIPNPTTCYDDYVQKKTEIMGKCWVEGVRVFLNGKIGILYVDEEARLKPYNLNDCWKFQDCEFIKTGIMFGLLEDGETDCPWTAEEISPLITPYAAY